MNASPEEVVPEIDTNGYSSFGALMGELMAGDISVPVWILIGRSRYLVTADTKNAICRGLMIALEMEFYRLTKK